MTAASILDNCSLFAAVGESSRARLLAIGQMQQFTKGALIFRQGEACPGVLIVGSGLVRVFRIAPNGKQHVLHLVKPGETVAEIAVVGDFACPAFAEAAAASECLLLPNAAFRQALETDHALCLALLTGFASRVRTVVDLLEDLTLRDATARVARWLLENTGADGRITPLPGLKKDIANRLNLTGETFSRMLRRLLDAGVIAPVNDCEFKVLSRDKLAALALGEFGL